MQGVNVFENGAGFLFKCLSLYTAGTGFLVLYILALVFIAICGSRRDKELFIPQAVVLLITVFNPVFPLILDKIFDVNSEYYRFFWIAPVVILVPYAATKLITDTEAGAERTVTVILVAAMFILGGNFVYGKGIDLAENIYKIPNELCTICDMIHDDSDDEYATAFFEYEYNMEVRQYDPKMILSVDREDYLYAVNYSYTQEMLSDEEKPVYKILARMVRNQKIDEEDFCEALDATHTEYVIVTAGHPQESFLKNAGLRKIAGTDKHNIYKYDLKERPDHPIVDYSMVDEHRLSFRRLK
ncbi:MAG: hypothetical protein IKQ40_06585 [Lachnospiraceae bacterium]|nr:hypothetical protein [Lachnospiraceae bacterium]